MKRREFIAAIAGSALAWPQPARTQQPIPVIGLLLGGSPDADAFRVDAVRQGLKEGGYVEGQTIAIEYRWAEDHYDRLPALATDLVRRQVLVLVAIGNAAAIAAKRATATIPVVFEVGFDPVEYGLVTSLARPTDNVTGVTFLGAELTSKQLEVLHEAVPKAAVIGMLENPNNPNAEVVRRDVKSTADALGRKFIIGNAAVESEIEGAITRLAQQPIGGLLVRTDVLFNGRPKLLVGLAARYALPAIFPLRDFPLAGGLMSYGASLREALRQTGVYVARILKGEKPADRAATFVDKVLKGTHPSAIPIEQPTKFELVVNVTTAKALGLTIPPTLLARADEVIE